jgi:CubicO group peptidase (beta-lactamase class C family)
MPPIHSIVRSLALLLVLLMATRVVAQPPSIDPAVLLGLWGSEQVLGPAVRGQLSLDGRGSGWTAEVGGYQVDVHRDGQQVAFALPNAAGEFHGRVSDDGTIVMGHWLQPGRVPGTFSFLSPVALKRAQAGVWRGEIEPLINRLSLYLKIDRAHDGSMTAFIRNPEQNFGAHRLFSVEVSDSGTTFQNVKRPADHLSATYDVAADRLAVAIPLEVEHGRMHPFVFDFTRRDRNGAIGFYPTTPPRDHYAYAPPLAEADGWRVASLVEVGLDPAPITAVLDNVLRTQTTGSTTPYIQGLLVARHGKLALESYFYGFTTARTHDLRSTGKSFTSALVGIAIDRHTGFGLDTPVVNLFPEYGPLSHPDPRKDRITVRHLLTMTSGLDCDDSVEKSLGNEDTLFAQKAQPDYYRFMLDLPMVQEPGNPVMHYCTGGMNLLGGVLKNATGRSFVDLFDAWIADPLQFRSYHLATQPTKEAYGGGGLYLRPRDALKLGQVYLGHGVWNGQRLISAAWVDQSTRRWAGYNAEHGYGFAWHLFNLTFGGRTYREYEAQGNGGQLIMVIPELDLAVTCVTGNYDDDETVPERELLAAIVQSIKD